MRQNQMIAAILLVIVAAAPTFAQTFDLSWNTFDGGGAMFTTDGLFELSGTIGQADAGSFANPMTDAGGTFELVGGFWPVAGGCVCPGDLNGDCQVTLADLSQLLSSFGACLGDPGFVPAADFDSSGCVDLADLSLLLSQFGASCA